MSLEAVYLSPRKHRGRRPAVKDVIKTCHGFAENTTMHGISYACNTSLVSMERFMWSIICIGVAMMAIYLITEVYINWQDFPAMTTLQTTGQPIDKIAYPAITICSQGRIPMVVKNVEKNLVHAYMKEKLGIAGNFCIYLSLTLPPLCHETQKKIIFENKTIFEE